MGSQRVGHDWGTSLSLFTFFNTYYMPKTVLAVMYKIPGLYHTILHFYQQHKLFKNPKKRQILPVHLDIKLAIFLLNLSVFWTYIPVYHHLVSDIKLI